MENLRPFTAKTTSESQVLGLADRGRQSQRTRTGWADVHGDTLGMDSSQVSVFEEGDQISLSSLLQRHDCG